MEIKRVIVTGGTGVTGNALVRYLLTKGIEVTAIIRPGSVREKYVPDDPGLRKVYAGLDDLLSDSLYDQLKDHSYDVFFHLAWDGSRGKEKVNNRNNFHMQSQNTTYAVDAVELCHRIDCKTFIMTGSQAEYGDYFEAKSISEDFPKKPVNGYGMAKFCAEEMTRALCREYGIRHIWPILFSVYGPRDATESMVDTSIRGLLKGESMDYTKGEQMWNYLYSFDAAKALLLLAEKGTDGECYNVASQNEKRLCEYINELYITITGKEAAGIGKRSYPGGRIKYLMADVDKLVSHTGFKEEYSFTEGIKEIADSIREEML
ncbi:MAG: NAD(P)-dependent oxidoreductase [Eubacterium sp.]|nr:NAD(P)-dependent oxidoreductase [Eubacterium sp.]